MDNCWRKFLLGISLVFSGTTWLGLGPFLRVPLHWCPFNSWHFQTSSLCAMKSVAGWGSEGWVDIIAGGRTGLPKHFIMALACMSWTRRTIQSTAGTSKGWKTQAITLVLSFLFRLASVLSSESLGLICLFGPHFHWKRWLKHQFLVTSFGF